MKRKKIFITTLVVFAILFGTKSLLWAQKSQEDRISRKTEHMAKKLDLSKVQKEEVYSINLKKIKARQDLKSTKSEMTRKERKEQLTKLRFEWKNELKTILDEAQLKKLGIE
ncbi:hypothetical protein [Winogradskyella sp. PE311]|uniref:hypothetical protein n=1 Tax=Winogradskyella sp. PE311 TaxID=3366943 RepID=UPI00397FDA33